MSITQLQTKFIAADELNSLMIFVDYTEMTKAFDLIKKNGYFAKIIQTPKEIFSASSLSIAVKNTDLENIQKQFELESVKPLKSIVLKRCALDYLFRSF